MIHFLIEVLHNVELSGQYMVKYKAFRRKGLQAISRQYRDSCIEHKTFSRYPVIPLISEPDLQHTMSELHNQTNIEPYAPSTVKDLKLVLEIHDFEPRGQ